MWFSFTRAPCTITSWPPQEAIITWPPFSQYDTRLLRQKTGGACLYMPQDGHWLAGFEVIPPPKLVFPRQKKENFNKGCAHTFEINLKSTKNLLFWLFLSGNSAVTPISTLANNNSTSDPAHQKVENFRPKLCFFSIFRRNFWHDFVTPFSTFANIKGCLPTKSTTPDWLR